MSILNTPKALFHRNSLHASHNSKLDHFDMSLLLIIAELAHSHDFTKQENIKR
jgi:hypothetical protein